MFVSVSVGLRENFNFGNEAISANNSFGSLKSVHYQNGTSVLSPHRRIYNHIH